MIRPNLSHLVDGEIDANAFFEERYVTDGMLHLSRPAAADVIRICVDSFKARSNGEPPAELLIHGRVQFEDDVVLAWTVMLDEYPAAGDMLATVAVGNSGHRDKATGTAYDDWETPVPLQIYVQHGGADIVQGPATFWGSLS